MNRHVVYDLEWAEVTPDGQVVRMKGPLDAILLGATVNGTPTQVRSPWEATVYIGDPKGGFTPQPNWLATALLRQSLTPGQLVPGSMVVLGPPDDDGAPTSISDRTFSDVEQAAQTNRGK